MKPILFLNRLAIRVGVTSIPSLSSFLIATCLLAPLTVSTASANLISNGSFESPVGPVTPGVNSVRPTGWSGYSSFPSGIINGTLANFPAPQNGNQFVNIASGDLVQAFNVVTPGDYLLTWFDNSLTSGWNGSYGVLVQDSSLATVSSTAYSYAYLGSAPWQTRSLDLPDLTAGTYTLTYGPGTSFTFLDNVVLDLKTTTSVPDAGSTAGLLGFAFVGMGLLARKQRNKFAD